MGVFEARKRNNSLKLTTKGFYFGHTEAEGENKAGNQNLDHYFEDYLNVIPQIADERFIFVGRKGTGKSAIAKFLKDASEKEHDSYCDLIKFNDIELEKVVQSIPEQDKTQLEGLIFEWLILVRLVKLFVKNQEAIYTREYEKLKNFLERNAEFVAIDKYYLTEIIDKKNYQLNIDVLKHVFGAEIGKYYDAKTTRAPFYKFINPLKDIIEKLLTFDVYKNNEYILLFDDLDINFKAEDSNSVNKLLSLLRAVKNLNTTVFRGTKVKVLVFLRDDIAEILETEDSDTSKLFSSYQIQLSWYDHEHYKLNENQTKLKEFVNKRISINFDTHLVNYNKEDPWSSLFEWDLPGNSDKTTFKHVLDYTFYRPRDLVLFLSSIGKEEYNFPIDNRTMRILLKNFVNQTIKELQSELSIHFNKPTITKLFTVCRKISMSNGAPREDIEKIIADEFFKPEEVTIIFNYLLSYSLLVKWDQGSGKIFFNYREKNQHMANSEKIKYTLHKCIYSYFNQDAI